MKTTKEKRLNQNILGLGFRPTTVCTRPATARIFNHTLLTKSVLIVADFASLQAGETGALAGSLKFAQSCKMRQNARQ